MNYFLKSTFCLHFSQIRFGLGIALNSFGILWFLFKFHRNVHTIKDDQISNNPWLSTSSLKLSITFLTGFSLFHFLIPHTSTYPYSQIKSLLFLFCIFIVLLKCYINQNDNLKLYVSVYHMQPPPVLPWQLPENFDPNSVKLVFIKSKSE